MDGNVFLCLLMIFTINCTFVLFSGFTFGEFLCLVVISFQYFVFQFIFVALFEYVLPDLPVHLFL